MTFDSETLPTNPERIKAPSDSREAFSSRYTELVGHLPELQDRPEVQRAGWELIDTFELRPSLFDTSSRALIFTAIASQWADIHADKASTDKQAGYLVDALTLLADEHSGVLAEVGNAIKQQEGFIDDKDMIEVYDAYTNYELTERVAQKIADGFLDETRQLLGITPENETHYTVRVFNFADEEQLYGIDAPQPDYTLRHDDPEYEARFQEVQSMKKWKQQLVANGERFVNDLAEKGNPHGGLAPAWVVRLRGTPTLCISTGLAQKILEPEIINNTPWYTTEQLSRDLAILSHEYTHTQGGLSDENARFGINLEELRAEHFSGNKQGYQDIKALFRDYTAVTGHDITAEFAVRPKGGSVEAIYTAIAQRVGLSALFDLLLASPKNYVDAQSDYTKRVFEAIGGYNGVLQKIVEQQIATEGEEAVERRMNQSAANLRRREASHPGSLSVWYAYRQQLGVTVVAEYVKDRIEPAP